MGTTEANVNAFSANRHAFVLEAQSQTVNRDSETFHKFVQAQCSTRILASLIHLRDGAGDVLKDMKDDFAQSALKDISHKADHAVNLFLSLHQSFLTILKMNACRSASILFLSHSAFYR